MFNSFPFSGEFKQFIIFGKPLSYSGNQYDNNSFSICTRNIAPGHRTNLAKDRKK